MVNYLSPIDAFKIGLEMMTSAIANDPIAESEMTLRTAFSLESQVLLSSAVTTYYKKSIGNNATIEGFKSAILPIKNQPK